MALPTTCQEWRVQAYPEPQFDPFKTFRLDKNVPLKTMGADEVLVKTTHFSNEPVQRTWVSDMPADRYYTRPVRKGELMGSMAIGEIIGSRDAGFEVGDRVFGAWGWTDYVVLKPDDLEGIASLQKIPRGLGSDKAMALGLTGWTAYVGLLKTVPLRPTDKTIVVSGAAGATGSFVCMIAKNILKMDRVIGIAGSSDKCELLRRQCGCDVALNYKAADFAEQLVAATPGYVDLYFDNTGGRILDLTMKRMAPFGRVIVCGTVSTYDTDESKAMAMSAESYFMTVSQKLTIQGFVIVHPENEQHVEDAKRLLPEWASQGKLTPLSTVWKARFDEVPEGMMKLIRGDNIGKLVTELV